MASTLSKQEIVWITEYKSQQTHNMVGGLKSDTPTPFVSIYLLSDFRLPLLLHSDLSSYVPHYVSGLN